MIRASFNPAPLQRKLQNRTRGFQASLPEQLRRAGRLVAVSLATSTQPYGDNDGARSLGETATARDVRRCYATYQDVYAAIPGKGIAGHFYKLVSAGNWPAAQNLINRFCPQFAGLSIGKPLDPQLHVKARNKRGRISDRQRPLQIVSALELRNYSERETARVGEGKGGWASCAKATGGTRGIPQWVTRHKSPGTVIEDRSDPERPTITLRNDVPYAENILSPADKAEAVQIALQKLGKALVQEEFKIARQHALA